MMLTQTEVASGATPTTSAKCIELRRTDHITNGSSDQVGALPLSHWYVHSVIRGYATDLGITGQERDAIGLPLYNLGQFDGTLDDVYTRLENYTAAQKTARRAVSAGRAAPTLTAKQWMALTVAAQDNLQAPGCWSMPQLQEGVQVQTLNRLEQHGLVEQRQERIAGNRPARFYRITDFGMRLCSPVAPPPTFEPHTKRELDAETRAKLRGMFVTETDDVTNRMVHALHIKSALRRVVINGNDVTIFQQWPDEDAPRTNYSAANYLNTLTAFIRLNEPEAVITDTRIIERKLHRPVDPAITIHNEDEQRAYSHRTARLLDRMRRSAWVVVTFHLVGERIPLLAAPAAPNGNGASAEPVADVPELPERWTALNDKQRAALLMLYEHSQTDAIGPDRWMKLDGLSDAEKQYLFDDLLIFLTADDVARINGRGMDLVLEVQNILSETQPVIVPQVNKGDVVLA